MYEKGDLVDSLLEQNSARRKRQKALDIRVIIGNPPYSAGQTSANDNNANIGYPGLDEKIRSTYAARSTATNKNALYDSYIRAIRWASDRIGESGVIGFVTNAGFLEANTADGLRQCLADEFSNIYVFHLRGNARTSGELRRKEKDNVFGMGTRTPIAISLLVKNPQASQCGQIFLHDIGDYLSREQKLEKITDFFSVAGISEVKGWQTIIPDQHGDWLKQRDDSFGEFIALGDKKSDGLKLFEIYSNGLKTNADAWMYNASSQLLSANMSRFTDTYNYETTRFLESDKSLSFEQFANMDSTKIKWHSGIIPKAIAGKFGYFDSNKIVPSTYRPFEKQYAYFDSMFVQRMALMPRIFPDAATENRVICLSGVGARNFSSLMTDTLPCLDNIEKGQCFPEYVFEADKEIATAQHSNYNECGTHESHHLPVDKPEQRLYGLDDRHLAGFTPDWRQPVLSDVSVRDGGGWTMSDAQQTDLFGADEQPKKIKRREAITDAGLAHFQAAYPGETLCKEDLFYYVYVMVKKWTQMTTTD